jgi:FkbM family methyltransferase
MNSAAPTVSTPNVALIIGITGQDGSYLAELMLEKAMWSLASSAGQAHSIQAAWFSSKAGESSFYYYLEGSGNASSANLTGRTDVKCVQCKVRTLDDYNAGNGARVDFVKCDVEGAELLVFQGGIETIKRDKPIVFF